MFSARLPWHLPKNRLGQILAEKHKAAVPIIDLTVGNPTLALPEIYAAKGQELLLALADSAGLRYIPSPRGDAAARQAIAAYYARRGLCAHAEHLVLCASTSEAYSWLFQLLCNPGEQVLFPQPSYPLIEFLSGLAGVQVTPYQLYLDGRWRIDLADLQQAIGPSTRAIVLISPNNPTGSLVHDSEWRALLQLCATRNLALIVDEVFGDYIVNANSDPHDPAWSSALLAPKSEKQPLCFVLSGLSKVLGLPQLKLGWIHVGGAEPLRGQAQDRLEIIADMFLSVGTPVQLATPRLLAAQPQLSAGIFARIIENLEQLRHGLQDTALQMLPVEGGFYAVVRLPRLCSEEEWVETLLLQDNLLCHPGYFFDFSQEAYVVLSLLSAPADLRTGIARLLHRTQQLA